MKTQEKTEIQEKKPFFQRLSVFLKAWHDYFAYNPSQYKLKPERYYRIKAYKERPPKDKMVYFQPYKKILQNSEWTGLAEAYIWAAKRDRKKAIEKDKALLWNNVKEAWRQLR
ncbi:hypothetical protein ACQRBK_00265 [Peptoniphilaceae bacterium SGI.137]|nr:hypothetical protein [Peptoniphilaceae bacterium]MDY6146527.1 hypothetical protein [Peptoniphilaceae bacterium]